MNKHAYCIIAHNEIEVLKLLIELIDDERNDIFLLIDSKVKSPQYYNLKTKYSKLFYTNQLNIRWGDISQIKAELLLLETACKQGKYDYYHILSGVDLPLKNQNYIHTFFRENKGKEFLGFAKDLNNEEDILFKTQSYHFFTPYLKSKNRLVRSFFYYLRNFLLNLQHALGFKRKYPFILKKGCNWMSISHDLTLYLISKKHFILKEFKYIPCVDEIFIQSIVWNSKFKDNIYDIEDEYSSCMREIDWQRGMPYIWGQGDDDIKRLINSNKLFARKFSYKYPNILDAIKKNIKS